MVYDTYMDKTTFTNDLLHTWDEILAELTPEERATLAKSTSQDWIEAIGECAVDPTFWGKIGVSFLNGLTNGLVK